MDVNMKLETEFQNYAAYRGMEWQIDKLVDRWKMGIHLDISLNLLVRYNYGLFRTRYKFFSTNQPRQNTNIEYLSTY